MRTLKVLPLIAWAFAQVSVALALPKDEAIKRFTDANRYYEAGHAAAADRDTDRAATQFDQAAKEYESLLADGYHNAQIFYNLGNSYYRLGQPGKAIANYLRAQALRPRDPAVAANLRQARLLVEDKRITDEVPELVSLTFFWYFYLNLDELLVVTLVSYLLLAAVLLTRIFVRKSAVRFSAIALGIVFGVLAISFAVKFRREVIVQRGVVTAKEVAVRYGNGAHYSVKFTVHEGAELVVEDERADEQKRPWVKATFLVALKANSADDRAPSDRLTGWVPAEVAERLSARPQQQAKPPSPTPTASANPQGESA